MPLSVIDAEVYVFAAVKARCLRYCHAAHGAAAMFTRRAERPLRDDAYLMRRRRLYVLSAAAAEAAPCHAAHATFI